MRQVRSPVYELTSQNVAAGVDAVPFRMSGEKCQVQIIDGPNALARVMGSSDGVTFVVLTWEGAAGVAALNNVGAGLYEVREQPTWIRFGSNQDAGAPQIFRAMFLVHVDD